LRKSLSQFVYKHYYTIAVGIFLRVTLIFDWVGGTFLQGGKKFAAQISLLLNYYALQMRFNLHLFFHEQIFIFFKLFRINTPQRNELLTLNHFIGILQSPVA
jgi:hypothetical protein